MCLKEEWKRLPKWCSLGAAASFLNVGGPVVRRMAEEGVLRPSFKTSGERGQWRISKEALAECIGLPVGDEEMDGGASGDGGGKRRG